MAAHWPNRCTGSRARTSGVIAASTRRGVEVERRGSMSAKAGSRRPCRRTTRWRRTRTATSGPVAGADRRAQPGTGSARRCPSAADRVLDADVGGDLASNAATVGPRMNAWDSTTSRIAASISSRSAAYWALRSSSGTGSTLPPAFGGDATMAAIGDPLGFPHTSIVFPLRLHGGRAVPAHRAVDAGVGSAAGGLLPETVQPWALSGWARGGVSALGALDLGVALQLGLDLAGKS